MEERRLTLETLLPLFTHGGGELRCDNSNPRKRGKLFENSSASIGKRKKKKKRAKLLSRPIRKGGKEKGIPPFYMNQIASQGRGKKLSSACEEKRKKGGKERMSHTAIAARRREKKKEGSCKTFLSIREKDHFA